jgi:hypothetical protein
MLLSSVGDQSLFVQEIQVLLRSLPFRMGLKFSRWGNMQHSRGAGGRPAGSAPFGHGRDHAYQAFAARGETGLTTDGGALARRRARDPPLNEFRVHA